MSVFQCAEAGTDETMTVGTEDGSYVSLAFENSATTGSVWLRPDEARKLAAEVVRLAEGVDSKPSVKVGDKLRVLVDFAVCANVRRGDILTVSSARHDNFSARGTDRKVWSFSAKELGSSLELILAPPTPDIKVGDTVRVLEDGAEFAEVKRGDTFKVARVRSGRQPYVVDDKNGGFWYFGPESVAKVAPPADVPSARETCVERAKALLAGIPHGATDIVFMATFLSGK